MLREVGVNVDCLPMLDVRQQGASDIIGDRALGTEPMQVAALGRADARRARFGGHLGMVKHIPGHGRAWSTATTSCRSSRASADISRSTSNRSSALRGAAMGMMAHVVYTAWDPDRPAIQSPFVIQDIIRERIGFDGFLMSDDISMEALTGDHGQRPPPASRPAAMSRCSATA